MCDRPEPAETTAAGVWDSEAWLSLTIFPVFFFFLLEAGDPMPSSPSSPDFPCNKAAVRKA